MFVSVEDMPKIETAENLQDKIIAGILYEDRDFNHGVLFVYSPGTEKFIDALYRQYGDIKYSEFDITNIIERKE